MENVPNIVLNIQPSPGPNHQQLGRPPSPLRNGYIPNTFTGIEDDESEDDEDDGDNGRSWRSPSPTSSVSQFAANFAQRVGSFVGNMAPSRSLPTEAEIEAEAERERDRSRREAERILTQEAEERRLVEEKVLAMMQSTRGGSPKSLPPPPRSQSLPNPPSPSTSHKEPSWWTAAKNRLTPTKEPLTPAQQVIQETKAREKEKKLLKGKEKEWPASSQSKYNDPAFLNLTIPANPPQRRPVPTSPSSPTPSRLAQTLTPSPGRSNSPSGEARPLYAQFNVQGTLDVPGTLLIITKRFEKLEKWTIGHVRALEDRMNDVERWLVEKEREKEAESTFHDSKSERTVSGAINHDIHEIREDVVELQGRVGELGREIATLATAPANLSSGPSRPSAQISVAPQTPSHTARPANTVTSSGPVTPRPPSSTVRESTSPPMSSSGSSRGSRTRLPYPSGDYATSQETATTSPPNSPPSSVSRPVSISGLPSAGLGTSSSPSPGLPKQSSPTNRTAHLFSPPMRKSPALNVSPTPRKRYTVALGGPITAPPSLSEREPHPVTPPSSRQRAFGTAHFSTSPAGFPDDDTDAAGEGDAHNYEFRDETIGKSSAAKFSQATNHHNNTNGKSTTTAHLQSSASPQPSPPRTRAQSTYGSSSFQSPASPSPTGPFASRLRSHSTDRFGPGAFDVGASASSLMSPTGGKFVDPLLLRKQEKESKTSISIPARGKVPVGQLVAFFDGDKRE